MFIGNCFAFLCTIVPALPIVIVCFENSRVYSIYNSFFSLFLQRFRTILRTRNYCDIWFWAFIFAMCAIRSSWIEPNKEICENHWAHFSTCQKQTCYHVKFTRKSTLFMRLNIWILIRLLLLYTDVRAVIVFACAKRSYMARMSIYVKNSERAPSPCCCEIMSMHARIFLANRTFCEHYFSSLRSTFVFFSSFHYVFLFAWLFCCCFFERRRKN